MGNIETSYDLSRDLTIAKATGKMNADDHRQWVKRFYGEGTVTSLILWDVREADYSEISTKDILEHVQETKALIANVQRGGKTAVVIDKDMLGYGLSRMREIYFDLEDVPIAMQTFSSMEDAMKWLGL